MIAHSQPGTPRPESTRPQQQPMYPPSEASLYQQSGAPFVARHTVRGRSSLFASDTGPQFESTRQYNNLYSYNKDTLLSVRVQPKMDRGFFLADHDWTCYRRNYFQISSVFSISGYSHYYVPEVHAMVKTEDGTFHPVQRFLLGVSASTASLEKEVELIQHTPKRDKGPQFRPEAKPITPGGSLNMSAVANNQSIVTFERVQFKTATANNGKRRAAQQYYVCVVDLYAETDRNQIVKIASCHSAPLVVRGRSPGHYADMQHRRPLPTAAEIMKIDHIENTSESSPNGHQHAFSYPKVPQQQQPMATHQQQQHDYNNQPQPQEYPYFAYTPQHYDHVPPLINASNSNNSAVSSPPLPSLYPHHSQVPNYAIHDAQNEHYGNGFQPHSHHEEHKMHHPQQHFNMQQTGSIESPHSGYDWQRARYNSASSGGSSSLPSPSITADGSQQSNYFAQQHNSNETPRSSSFSPTAPYIAANNTGRKYNVAVAKKEMI